MTTRLGDRIDAAQAFWVQHRFADGRKFGVDDRHLLELGWEDGNELMAVFLDRADCMRALDAFIRQGWVPLVPVRFAYEGRAVNPARVRSSRTSADVDHTWRAQLDVVPGGFAQPFATGLSRGEALKRVGELCEQLEAGTATWVDPDFTRPAWRSVTAAADGLVG